MSLGGGLVALQFFGHLKRELELFVFVKMSPLPTFRAHWVYTITPEKKKKTNKHASVIFLLAKNAKFHIFVDRSLKPLQ